MTEQIIDGIRITTDDNGNQHFEPVEKSKPAIIVDDRSWWQKLCDWWNDAPVTPYIKKRDLSDPFGDKNYDGGTHKAWEAGIKIKF